MREFDLLEHIYAANARLSSRVIIPPGDDMAQVELRSTKLLAAVDQLVAGRHIDLATTPLPLVGRKAVTRSLSDIAAMAGRPVATLVAATLPPDFGAERAETLFDAMRVTCEQYDSPLVGGDIAFHCRPEHPLVCSVTVLAEPSWAVAVTRGGAQVGDDVYVTGRLGGAVTGDGGGRHLTFEPRIAEAIELLGHLTLRLHAMIDISDGLGRDAGHIADQSGVTLVLDAAAVPCTPGIPWREAVSGGEDYELCFTATGRVPLKLGDVPVARIGIVAPRRGGDGGGVVFREGGCEIPGAAMGWQHES